MGRRHGKFELRQNNDTILSADSLEEIREQIDLQMGDMDLDDEEGWF